MRSLHAKDIGDRHDPRHAPYLAGVIPVRSRIDDNEAASSGILFADQRESGGGLIVAIDDHVLEQLTEAGLDGALIAAVDLEIVGHGALLTNMTVGLHQHRARGVAEIGATRGELLERGEAGFERRDILFARTDLAGAPFVFATRGRELRPSRGQIDADGLECRTGTRQRVGGSGTFGQHAFVFAPVIVLLDVQLSERLPHAFLLRRGVLHDMAHRHDGVDRGEEIRARSLDIRLEAFDSLQRSGMFFVGGGEQANRFFARLLGLDRSLTTRLDRNARRFTTLLELADLDVDFGAARVEALSLLPIEFLLLLATCDVELASMRSFANRRRTVVGFGLPDTESAEIGFHLGHACRGGGLPFACFAPPGTSPFDAAAQLAVSSREQDLLPSSQLVAQTTIAARLRRLTLECAALLLDLEHDVVDADEILLGRFEL